MVLLSVFFVAPAHDPALHSFPPRLSSDLLVSIPPTFTGACSACSRALRLARGLRISLVQLHAPSPAADLVVVVVAVVVVLEV